MTYKFKNKYNLGRKLSDEHKEKLRNPSDETREKMRQSQLGKKLSPESIAKRTETQRKNRLIKKLTHKDPHFAY